MIDDASRKEQFDAAMSDVYERAKVHGYNARDYKIMLERDGPEATARRCVLKADGVPSGVFRLMELGIPEISVEAVVVRFADLFTDERDLVAAASERLRWMKSPEAQRRARELRASLRSPTSR